MMRETIYLEITSDRPEGPTQPRRDAVAIANAIVGTVQDDLAELHPRVDLTDIRPAEDAS